MVSREEPRCEEPASSRTHVTASLIPTPTCPGSYITSTKTKGRLSLGFEVFNALTVTAFNLCYFAEFDSEYLAKVWKAPGRSMPINKPGLGESQVLSRLKSRSSPGFLFKADSKFKPGLEEYVQETKARAEEKAQARSKTAAASATARPASDEELYGFDAYGSIGYLGTGRMRMKDDASNDDDEAASAVDRDGAVTLADRREVESSPPRPTAGGANPSTPERPEQEAVDVDANDTALSPGSRELIHVHSCALRPEMLTGQRLLHADGCYNDDLVDIFFTETAIDKGTVAFSVNLAIKLSEKDGDGHRYEPVDLIKLAGKKMKFEKRGLVSFPISVCTVAERTISATGVTTATVQNDFHYSTALYSVDDNKIYHADSLDFRSHKWVKEVANKQGRELDKPQYMKVSFRNKAPQCIADRLLS